MCLPAFLLKRFCFQQYQVSLWLNRGFHQFQSNSCTPGDWPVHILSFSLTYCNILFFIIFFKFIFQYWCRLLIGLHFLCGDLHKIKYELCCELFYERVVIVFPYRQNHILMKLSLSFPHTIYQTVPFEWLMIRNSHAVCQKYWWVSRKLFCRFWSSVGERSSVTQVLDFLFFLSDFTQYSARFVLLLQSRCPWINSFIVVTFCWDICCFVQLISEHLESRPNT